MRDDPVEAFRVNVLGAYNVARAAVAAGVAGLFMETHPEPEKAHSDGPNSWPLDRMAELLEQLAALDAVAKSRPYLEDEWLAGS